ncbi:MAG: uroporphyrinogen-III C-methyltransferase [Aeromonas sp.]
MDFFPLFCQLQHKPVLIVGGTQQAARSARLLLDAKAQVTVNAPQVVPELLALAEQGELTICLGTFHPALLEGKWLVIAAADQPAINQQVFTEAHLRQIFCNGIDDDGQDPNTLASQAHSSAILPTLIQRSPLMVAMTSGGAAPSLNRQWQKSEELPRSSPRGSVTLVGAGPGDAGLLTLHGLQHLQQADLVVYDRLVSREVLSLINPTAEQIFVGKEPGRHCVPQHAINQLLLEHAQLGKQVVRLKGGDPFIFGRGGEELETLAQAGISFAVVPGITAASGCAAYSGIPLTHRDHAQRVVFITGHDKGGNITQEWSALTIPHQTLVFYMGLAHAARIQDELQTHGMPAHTPVALIEKGTQPTQRVVRGELQQLAELASLVTSPSLIIIGSVVTLADHLDWYHKPDPCCDDARALDDLELTARP